MDVDDQVRQVLRKSLTPVDDLATARRHVLRRAATMRRHRQWVRAAAVAAAAGAVVAVVATMAWMGRSASDTRPIIGPAPDAEPTPSPDQEAGLSDVCESLRVDDQVEAFLEVWTSSAASLREDRCVLAGRLGPPPEFDTTDLGPEQRLLVGDLPEDIDLQARRPTASDYPLVHLGRIEDTDAQLFLEWRFEGFVTPVACVEGSCAEDGLPTSRLGVIGIGRSSGPSGSILTVTVWVPPEAAAVALELDGRPVLWQRPVSLTADLFVDGYLPSPDATFRVRVFDRRGQTIDTHDGEIAP